MTESVSGTTDDRAQVEPPVAAGADDPATETTPPAEPAADPVEVKGLDRRRGLGGLLRSPVLAWTVAVLALAAAAFAGVQWADLYAADKERGEVRQGATRAALRLTTFDGAEIEDWYADVLTTATGEYADQLRQVFDQPTRDQLREIQAVSRGEVENLFIQDVDGNQARAFALVTQTYTNASTTDPVEDHLRMDITMQKVEDQWLASEVAVLGPSGVIAPTGDPTEPAPGGDQ